MLLVLRKVKTFIKNPFSIIQKINDRGFLQRVSDETYLKWNFKQKMGQKLNLENPETFNEKIQWIKLNYRNPLMTESADKYKVRNHIKEEIGEEYLNDLLAVYETVEEIDLSILPQKFVLKATHSSRQNLIVKNKEKINWKQEIDNMKKWLNTNWYYHGRQWGYKNIKPRIIAEKYMKDNDSKDLKDYKIMCFNGVPRIIQVMSERDGVEYSINHFDLNWEEIIIDRKSVVRNKIVPKKPKNLQKMIQYSKKLSKPFPFVRVDFYEVNGDLIFGELTFYPANGYIDFTRKEDDLLWGKWLKLPEKM